MDGNFNNEQNDYMNEEFTEASPQKKFDEAPTDHLVQAANRAKLAFDMGLIGLLGGIGCIFCYFGLQRLLYVMILLPVFPVAGIVSGIMALRIDKGLPKAYIGIVLSVLSILPSLICVFLFIWDLFLYRLL